MQHYTIGIDLGGTNIKGALVERGEGAVTQQQTPTRADEGPEAVLDRITDLIQELMAEAPGDVGGIGIGAPGNINLDRTTLSYPPNLPGWEVVDMRAAIRDRLGTTMPVLVENDANVAGLGSAHYGAGRPYDSFVMVTLGTGVGGAVILNNEIYRGTTGSAGEIGHMSIDYEGPIPRSGVAGAIEAYLGQHFLTRYARYRLLTDERTMLHEMAGPDLEDLSPKMLHEAALRGDRPAIEVLEWAGHKFGVFLGGIVHLLDVRTFIVGGGVSAAGDFILNPARTSIQRYVMPGMRDGLEIIQETLGNQVGILGAAHLVVQYLDAHASSGPSADAP
ncbi:MAG: ROK family protein [Bacteroidetes bacterium]|jgi:glucokinase|nr:ROK family protein [Bacteroidota bacterium]